jgi:hypothetical protein
MAASRGYLQLYDGARRHWDDWVAWGNWKGTGPCSREEAERRIKDPSHPWYRKGPPHRIDTHKAMNALIQGSAARHTKLWMRACWREGITPLLQMHDSLDCSVASPELAERVAQLGREAVTLEVPIQVDLKFGKSWGDAVYTWDKLCNGIKIHSVVTESEISLSTSDDQALLDTGNPARNSGDDVHESDDVDTDQDGDEHNHNDNHAGQQQHAGSNDSYAHGERDTGRRVAFFIYRHADGQPYLGVKKTSTKQFPQYHWDGRKWAKGAPKGPKIPYRLPELIRTPLDALIIIAAGEKDAETAAAFDFVATTNPGGEGKGKWVPELNAWFVGRKRIAIMEDNDATGRAHVIEVAGALRNMVSDIRIVTFHDLPEHGDLTDWKERGHGRDDLLAKIEAARPYHPRPQASPIRQWDGEPVPELEYAVPDRFPLENVGLFSGEGGQGKSSLVRPLWVISGHWPVSTSRPLYPQKRTWDSFSKCPLCYHRRTHALQQKNPSRTVFAVQSPAMFGGA